MKYYHTWKELNDNMGDICQQMAMDNYKPDVILGPGRGGYPMGVMLSHYFNVPFEGFQLSLRDHKVEENEALDILLSKYNGKKILICDDINDSGSTLNIIDERCEKLLTNAPTYCTIYDKLSSKFGKKVDYTAKEVGADEERWIVFPYEEWWK